MVQKLNPNVRNFLILGMGIGFAIIAIGELGDFVLEADVRFSGFEILSVEQDPVTGEIIGSVILGKPIVAGYGWTGAPSRSNPTCSLGTQSVSFAGSVAWSSGASSGGCSYGFAEWDTSELPDDFDAENLELKLKFSTKKFGYPVNVAGRNCKIGVIEQPISTIEKSVFNRKLFTPDSVAIDGDWCQTKGIKTLVFNPATSDAFERAVRGDDRFTLSFTLSTLAKGTLCCYTLDNNFWGTEGSLEIDGKAEPVTCPTGTHQVQFKCEPLDCGTGFQVSGNTCTEIICSAGSDLDTASNTCKAIQCEVGQRVNLQTNNCENIICSQGTILIGNDCEAIICETGFVLSGNECTVITCPVGNELVGSSCQQISCPLGTFLQGNNCPDIVCPTGTHLVANDCEQIICNEGENLIGNICKPIQCNLGEMLVGNNCEIIVCQTGTELVGSDCVQIQCASDQKLEGNNCVNAPIECPIGTVANKNVCIQIIPQLQATGAPVSLLTITGVGIFLISFGGFIVRGIARKGF